MLTITAAARTHVGRVRKLNEDSVLVTDRFVAVCDGLGGHAAGEVASGLAAQRLERLEQLHRVHPDDVVAAIADANHEILVEMRRHPENQGMGTTVTGFGIVDVGGSDHCVVFNVGDSRVYRLADAALRQVTVDHSEVEELRASGAITAAAAAVHPRRNVVTRCLGSIPGPTPDLWVFPGEPGDRYLACSDGLTNEVDDAGIAELLTAHADPAAAADALVDQALSAGGRDNITVIVVDLASVERGAVDVDTAPRSRTLPG